MESYLKTTGVSVEDFVDVTKRARFLQSALP